MNDDILPMTEILAGYLKSKDLYVNIVHHYGNFIENYIDVCVCSRPSWRFRVIIKENGVWVRQPGPGLWTSFKYDACNPEFDPEPFARSIYQTIKSKCN